MRSNDFTVLFELTQYPIPTIRSNFPFGFTYL